MFNGKPLIVKKPPWYRHHWFPWGWYRLKNLSLSVGDTVETCGYFRPEDGGGTIYKICPPETVVNGVGSIINWPGDRAKCLFKEE